MSGKIAIIVVLISLVMGSVGVPPFSLARETELLLRTDPFLLDKVKVRAWVENGPEVAVTQQVELIVEVSTQTWFTRGTRIKDIELADAVVRRVGRFATNFTRREKNQTWSVQQWTVFLYPLKAKTYQIPDIPVVVSIAGEDGKTVSGEVCTRPVQFKAIWPTGLAGVDNWVATPRLTVREHYSTGLDDPETGDAIKRRIEVEADRLPAMMLPNFSVFQSKGLAVYEDPPKLRDRTNRGESVGRRVEQTTYFIEKPGVYQIPARVYTWWNVEKKKIETIELPAQTITTRGLTGPLAPGEDEKQNPYKENRRLLGWIIFLLVFSVVLTAGALLHRRNRSRQTKTHPSEARLKQALKRASARGDQKEALRILYQWLDHYGGREGPALRRFLHARGAFEEMAHFDRLMAGLYGPGPIDIGSSNFPVYFYRTICNHHKMASSRARATAWVRLLASNLPKIL
ncbi:MAG: BatD family protein [Deltaproteobacteria bacterium]|nr:BatD family protein [Deltaproteobacteria bacterium]